MRMLRIWAVVAAIALLVGSVSETALADKPSAPPGAPDQQAQIDELTDQVAALQLQVEALEAAVDGLPDYGDRIAAVEAALAVEVAARMAADADLSARVETLEVAVLAVPTGLVELVHADGGLADGLFDLWVAMWLAPDGGALARLDALEAVSHNP